jgi:hypothetical protein
LNSLHEPLHTCTTEYSTDIIHTKIPELETLKKKNSETGAVLVLR